MPYVTRDQVKKYNGITWTSGLDSFIDTLIAAATNYVEGFTGRVFLAPDPDTATTKYYDGNGQPTLTIDDLRELVSLVVDGEELIEDEDFYLYPLNAPDDGAPYTRIELIQPSTRLNQNSRMQIDSPYIFDVAQATIEVEGKWGYSETPPEDVMVAVMKLVGGLIKDNIGDTDLREVASESLGEYSVSYTKIKETANTLGIDALLVGYQQSRPRAPRGGVVQVS